MSKQRNVRIGNYQREQGAKARRVKEKLASRQEQPTESPAADASAKEDPYTRLRGKLDSDNDRKKQK